MMILFLIITAALTLYAAFHIVAPFFQSREDQLRFEVLDEDLRRIEELVAQRAYLLKSLRELQLDYDTGKIPDDDYEQTRKKLELEAVTVLRELDEVHGGRGWQQAIDEELSERIQGIRQRGSEESTGTLEAKIEAGSDEPVSDDVEAAPEGHELDCPECGKSMEVDARFCSQCGHAFDDEPEDQAVAGDESADDDETAGASEPAAVDDLVTDQNTDMGDSSAEVAR
ncbi:MAG: zinc ribbon domain-containing protein [Myxococcota bacterium]